MRIIKPSVEILTPIDGEAILKHIELCARNCYKSESKITNESAFKMITSLIKRGHLSPIEHFNITARIICDRGVMAEITRHRLVSFSIESTRYVNYANDGHLTFIQPCWVDDIVCGKHDIKWNGVWGSELPISNKLDKPSNRWFWNMAIAERDYNRLIAEGWTPEKARSILPNSLKTDIIMTANLREWLHFFKLRTDKASHPQMREVAIMLLREFQNRIPAVFDGIKVTE